MGAVRWVRELGTATWDEGSFLSTRYEGYLVLAGAARGLVATGTGLVGGRGEAHVMRIDLAPGSGDVLSARVLGEGETGAFRGDLNARGDLLTSVLQSSASTSMPEAAAHASLSGSDGAIRWARAVPWLWVALDDSGRSYLVGWGGARSIDELGRDRWRTSFSSVIGHGPIDRIALRRDGLDVFSGAWSRSEWIGVSGTANPRCVQWFFRSAEVHLDLAGHVVGRPPEVDGLLARFEGHGRRCDLRVDWSFSACGAVPDTIDRGELMCSRVAGPACPRGQSACGEACLSLDTDPLNCGACGRSCAGAFPGAAGYCRDGACVYGVCEQGRASCDGDPANGCEADLVRDGAHCGRCGRACALGATCVDGQCCAGGRCTPPLTSDGIDGAFAPTADVTLAPGVHHYTTVAIPAGVTVRAEPGAALDLRATGDVLIDGTIDLRGREGACCGGSDGPRCEDQAPPGPAPGTSGVSSSLPSCTARWRIDDAEPAEALMPLAYDQPARPRYDGACGGHNDTPPGTFFHGFPASSGSIGLEAFEDLAVNRVLSPGSRGGSNVTPAYDISSLGCIRSIGGGGGGALRIASPTRIILGTSARLLASGGAAGRTFTAGGSGGALALHAPEVRIPNGATVDASGTALGRVRISVDPARCELSGTVAPPLVGGCTPTPPERAVGHAYVGRWPL